VLSNNKGTSAALSFADIHDDILQRLDYLISFSSQFIFVSGNNPSDCTHIVETYLERHAENAQKVYLRPGRGQSNSIQKELLVRQIVPDANVDMSRPLHDIIFRLLGDEPKQLLIVIDNAQFLPNNLILELWNLILQNQFAHEKHHIDIVLSGDRTWVSSNVNQIPHNSAEKPICIDVPDTRPIEHQWLEKVARNKRTEIENAKPVKDPPPKQSAQRFKTDYKNFAWLLKLAFVGGVVLLAGFYGLNSLYQLDSQSLEEFNAFLTQQEKTESKSLSHYQRLMQPGVIDDSAAIAPQQNTQTDKTETENQLVGSWQELKEHEHQVKQQPIQNGTSELAINQSAIAEFEEPSISVSRPAEVVGEQQANAEPQTTPSQTAAIAEIPSLPFDNEEILKMSPQGYTLQLSGLSSVQVLEEFLIEHSLVDEAMVYQTQRGSNPWWVVIFGEYDTLAAARSATQQLPSSARQIQPWAKSLATVHQEIRQIN
jgi:DamX protein